MSQRMPHSVTKPRICHDLLVVLVLLIAGGASAQGVVLSEDFDGSLSQWTGFGSPASAITSDLGDPSPCLAINGDSNYDSGLNSVQTFAWTPGLTAEFDLHPDQTAPIDQNFTDGGAGFGIGNPEITGSVAVIRWRWDIDGRFDFFGGGAVSTYTVTTRRWVPCKITLNSNYECEFYIDGQLLHVSAPITNPSEPIHFLVSGRDHYIDNIEVSYACTDLDETFDGDLSQWTHFGSPSSFISAGEGDPAPCLNINGDSNYDSGLNSACTFEWAPGLTAEFELHPTSSANLGQFFTDGGAGFGIGVPEQTGYVAAIRWRWDIDGRFDFFGGGAVSTYTVTEKRWVPCKIRLNADYECEFYVDGQLLHVSAPVTNPIEPIHCLISGRSHLVDNVQIYYASDPDLALTQFSVPAAVEQGCTELVADFQVVNLGESESGPFDITVRASATGTPTVGDPLVMTVPVASLAAGDTINIQHAADISASVPVGDIVLGAFVDEADLIIELDELNNSATSSLFYPVPQVVSVADVPNDQGRQVRINFLGTTYDAAGSTAPIIQYEVFRRIDSGLKSRSVPALMGRTQISQDPAKTAGWEFVGAVPAHAEAEYNVIVPTLADSTEAGDHLSNFFVRAATSEPAVFFDSCVGEGHSIDNLAPAAPSGLEVTYSASGNDVDWLPAKESDLRCYRIYRGTTSDFVPVAGAHVDTVTVNTWTDEETWGVYYRVSAVDFAGNESAFATDAEPSGVAGRPVVPRPQLHGNYPNPFNPLTAISFTVPTGGMELELAVYDARGRRIRVLATGALVGGDHKVKWNGTSADGRRMPSGIYFLRLEGDGFLEVKKATLLK